VVKELDYFMSPVAVSHYKRENTYVKHAASNFIVTEGMCRKVDCNGLHTRKLIMWQHMTANC